VPSVIIDRIIEKETPYRGQLVGRGIPLGDLPIRRAVDVGLGCTRTLQFEGAGRYHFFNWIDLAKQDLIHFEIGTDVFRTGMRGNPLILFVQKARTVLVFLSHTDIVLDIEPIIGEHLSEG
jgi:hypothetical protein